MWAKLWESNGFQLLFGIFGIYSCYWVAGVFQQKVSKTPYEITNTVEQELFQSPVALLYFPCGVAWLFGFAVNRLFYNQHTEMPAPNLIACAIMVCISTHTYMLAIYLTNFPIVMIVKACNIVSVVVVGVFCSRVRDKSLALGPKKIVVAALVSVGIVMYNFGGDAKHQQKATDPLGIVLLTISLIADGFLPDFQAVIKAQYKPRPLQMFQHINKWVTIISLFYALISGQLSFAHSFVTKYPELGYDMIKLSCLTTIGQVFVYRMIKQFKQHIVPFVITTRKIFTVVISIIFFHHQTTIWQILAIILIFCTSSTQYISEIYSSKKNESHVKLPSQSSREMLEQQIKDTDLNEDSSLVRQQKD